MPINNSVPIYGGVTAGPLAVGGVSVSAFHDQQHFAYRDKNSTIWDAFYAQTGNKWSLQQINTKDSQGQVHPAASDIFVSVFAAADQQHFTYTDSAGNIWDSFYSRGDNSWHFQQINTRESQGIHRPAGRIFVSAFFDQQHFVFHDSNGTIWDAFYAQTGNKWSLQQINTKDSQGRVQPAASDVFVSVFHDQQHFTYTDRAGNIWDSFYVRGDNSWHFQQINTTDSQGRVHPAVGDIFVSVFDAADQQHFAYIDSAGNVWDSFYIRGDNSWHFQQINTANNQVTHIPAGRIFVSAFDDQQHFAFRDRSGVIWDSFYAQTGNSWHFQQINTTDSQGRVHPAVGDIFVSVFNAADQQHFAYIDSAGVIWDSFYIRGDNSWHFQQINNGTTWTSLHNSPGNFANAVWLMQDGSVLANLYNSKQLMALHPDGAGSYANGSWSSAGNFLLEKRAFTSAVLSDGRLVACGGEYSGPGVNQKTETNFCEIYDPHNQSSTQFSPPAGWTSIGDSPSAVLNDGTLLIGNTQGIGNKVALLDPSTLTWTIGGGDSDNEQGYTLLQTGDVLTTGVYTQTSMRYDVGKKAFVQDAPLPVMLGANLNEGGQISGEIGPGITLMAGRVIWFGATGHTCIYTPGGAGNNGTWVQGPDLPTISNGVQTIAADVPAILEPNGKVMLAASGPSPAPSLFLEYDPAINGFIVVAGAPSGIDDDCRMLLMPNGHGLVSLSNGAWYDVAFAVGGDPSWAPTITSFPPTVARNNTVTLAGTQLCGLSECQSYGDDNQQAENYPMVRFVDLRGGVTYARAHDVSTRSIAPRQPGSVLVDIPASLELATYSVQVVAMGIPSGPGTTVNVVAHSLNQTGTGIVVARTSDHLDVFWVAPDLSVRSNWWDVNSNNGNWNNAFEIASPGAALPEAPCAVSRYPDHLDVFWVAPDLSVRSNWWDVNSNNGNWNNPFEIAPAGSALPGSVACVARTPNHLDVFWVAPDLSVRSNWWDVNSNNGNWNNPFEIAPAGSALPGSVACVARTPNHLDVFWVAPDLSVRSNWWDVNSNNGNWNNPFEIAPAGSTLPGSVACVARTPNHLDVFWVAPDLSVRSNWWDVNSNNGNWNNPFEIAPPGSALPGSVACVARTPNHLDVFWVAPDLSVRSNWWDVNSNNGNWNNPFEIAPPGSALPGSVACVARTPNHLDVFWVAPDLSVRSNWWDVNSNNGNWNNPFEIAPAGSGLPDLNSSPPAPGSSAVTRQPNHIDMFWASPDGSVMSAWWDAFANNGQWNKSFAIAPVKSSFDKERVTGAARQANHLDVFWVSPDGSVLSAWWDAFANNGQWNNPFSVAPAKSAAPGSAVSVGTRQANHLDVFWVAPDGSVMSAWWDTFANNGQWNKPFSVAPANSAAPGSVVAVGTRQANHIDVFWVSPDGSVLSAWWDAFANNGQWNNPFSVAPAKSAAPGSAVSVGTRQANHLDVFWVAPDGSVMSAWWDAFANNGQWNKPFSVAPANSAAPGSVVAVGTRQANHIDVFWVSPDGSVLSAWWDAFANNGQWNNPFSVAPAKSAAPGSAVSVGTRQANHIDVFWVAPDGSVMSAWWDAFAHNGQWNNPFSIAQPGSA